MVNFLGDELDVDVSTSISDFELSNIYHEAAICLFACSKDARRSGNPGVYHRFIYPSMNNGRISLELNLKFLAQKLKIPSPQKPKKSGHDLLYYWNAIKQKTNDLKDIWPQEYKRQFFDDINSFIAYIDEIDPNSSAFRFAFNKDGSARALQGVANLSYDDHIERFTLAHYVLSAIIKIVE